MTAHLAQVRTLSGTVTGLVQRRTRQGREWASATFTTDDHSAELLVFPDSYLRLADRLAEGAALTLDCRVSHHQGVTRLVVHEPATPDVFPLADVLAKEI